MTGNNARVPVFVGGVFGNSSFVLRLYNIDLANLPDNLVMQTRYADVITGQPFSVLANADNKDTTRLRIRITNPLSDSAFSVFLQPMTECVLVSRDVT